MSTINNNIWTVEPYIYKATVSGVDIFDFDSVGLIDHIPHAGGVNSVWADDTYLYIGTTDSGVYRATTSGFSPAVYKQYPDLLSNTVLYLHGNEDYITIATVSGVDNYNTDTNDRISTVVSGTPEKCYQTADQVHYFYTNGSPISFGGLHHSIYNWEYVKHIELDGPIPLDGYQYNITLTQDDIFENSYGYDVRILQNNGRSAPYIFQNWEPLTDITITMLLDKDVTDVYIIYGFEKSVQYEGAPSDIYEFYDDFSYTELPEDVWTFSSPDSQSSYILDGNTIRLRDYYNNGSRLTTTASFSVYNRIDIRWRRNVWSGDYGDMDSSYGLNGGVIIPIGGTDVNTEDKHSIKYANNDLAVGTEDIKSTFLTATSWVDDGYQKSVYNGEVLTASATIPESTGTLFIGVGNSSNAPDIEVDWVKVSKFSALEPNYTEHPAVLISESNFVARLYAIYSDSSSYIYTSGLDEIIQASHINDIYVTEGTSQYGNGNVLFLATDLGAVVIEERRGDEINSRFKYYRLDT